MRSHPLTKVILCLLVVALLLSSCGRKGDAGLSTAVAQAIAATQTVEAEIQRRVDATVAASAGAAVPSGTPGASRTSAAVLAATTSATVPALAGGEVRAGNAAVVFEAGSLPSDAVVTVSELASDETIGGGVVVDTQGVSPSTPVEVRFAITGDFAAGQLVALVSAEQGSSTWEPAVFTDGSPVIGIIGNDGVLTTLVDHFSAYALPIEVAYTAGLVGDSVWGDTSQESILDGVDAYIPIEFQAERVLTGVPLGFFGIDIPELEFPFAHRGLRDDALRVDRYAEVLAELFTQREVPLDAEWIGALEETLTSASAYVDSQALGLDFALPDKMATSQLVRYDQGFRDALRAYRGTAGWSEYARLDYVARRLDQYVTRAQEAAQVVDVALLVGRDLHRFLVVQSLNDALVMQRMDDFEALLEGQAYDAAIWAGYQKARKEVEARLDNEILGVVDAITGSWLEHLGAGKNVAVIAGGKSLTSLAPYLPYINGFLMFYQSYDNVIVDAYADIQRASLAATMVIDLFSGLTEEVVKAGDPATTNQALMQIYLGWYFYQRVYERRSNGATGSIIRLFKALWSWRSQDRWATIEFERLSYLKLTADEFRKDYVLLEGSRQADLAAELARLETATPLPQTPAPEPATPTAEPSTPTPALPPTPTPSPTPFCGGGLVAFQSMRDGNQEIYVMKTDGSGATNLTNSQTTDALPAWSPDARLIGFSSQHGGPPDIYVMNADGSDLTRLTDDPAGDWELTWSPDGRRIAFQSNRDPNGELYIMNADGSGQTRLTHNSHDGELSPSWSPDGLAIAFTSNADDNWEIYVINVDGSGLARLTNNPATEGSPAWSPDGRRLAFSSNRDGNHNIYVMNSDGSRQTRLTSDSADDWSPAWSPNGQCIAFVSNRDGNDEIYVMGSSGSHAANLTNNRAQDGWPAWSR